MIIQLDVRVNGHNAHDNKNNTKPMICILFNIDFIYKCL